MLVNIKECFKLSEKFLEKYTGKQPEWGPAGYITYKRSYARDVVTMNGKDYDYPNFVKKCGGLQESKKIIDSNKATKRSEEWWETLKRVVEGCYTIQLNHCLNLKLPWNPHKAQKSAQEMFRLMWDFKFLPPGRGLWAMGADVIYERGGGCLNNPLHVNTKILTKQFGWTPLLNIIGKDITVLSNRQLFARDENYKIKDRKPVWVNATISHIEEHPCKKIEFENNLGVRTSVIASNNHRWFVIRNGEWVRRNTEQLLINDVFPETRILSKTHSYHIENEDFNEGIKYIISNNEYKLRKKYEVNSNCIYGFLSGCFFEIGNITEDNTAVMISRNLDIIELMKIKFEQLHVKTTDIKSSNNEYYITIDLFDLCETFFIKDSHILMNNRQKLTKNNKLTNKLRVINIEELPGTYPVACAIVPEYEQFVIEGNCLTSNCAFVSTEQIDTSFSEPFRFLMDMSLLGVGVAFDTLGSNKIELKQPKYDDTVHIVEDSREGWVELCKRILDAYNGIGTIPNNIDYTNIRKKGEPIITFGGIAPGADPLIKCINNLRLVLDKYIGKKVDSALIVDIMNILGACVVCGGIRRVAELALGQSDDEIFLKLKDYTLFEQEMKNWRWASNNTISCKIGQSYENLSTQTASNGEPGYFWLENAKKYGRIKDGENWVDINVQGTNPCGEQSLESTEICNLVETFPSLHDSFEEYKRTLKFAYLYAKTVTLIPTHYERTNQVMFRNRRIGLSQSGIVQAFKKFGRRNFLNICDNSYEYVRALDKKYSGWLCVPVSIKCTTVKPSGSISLLPGVTPGIHFAHSQYYMRLIELTDGSPLVKLCQEAGYKLEKSYYKDGTQVVYIPVEEKDFDRCKKDISMWEQLEMATLMQTYWSDNQVSITVTFNKHEAKDIGKALELYEDRLKSVSFLPLSDHKYKQAPYQECTKEEYDEYIKKIKPIAFINISTHDALGEDKFCDGDSCKIVK